MKLQIVKVQISLATSHDEAQVLAYNESRSSQYEGTATKEMIKAVGPDMKKFFYAKIPKKAGLITLLGEAPWQDW